MKWKTVPGKPGVRYREHKTRKHGNRLDRYYVIRYRLNGVTKNEAIGWASDGATVPSAFRLLNELKVAQRTGEGPQTLQEKRALVVERKEEKERVIREQERDNLTFGDLFEGQYFPHASQNKVADSLRREQNLFKFWISPVIGNCPLKDIGAGELEKIKTSMQSAGKSARSIQYAMAVIRQVYNYATHRGLFQGVVPTKFIKLPKVDNRRERFLTPDEAGLLLNELLKRDQSTYEISLLSLHCGLRAGEIFALRWADIDLSKGLVSIRDTKTGRNRMAHMTGDVSEMLEARASSDLQQYVFPHKKGGPLKEVPNPFRTAVKHLGFNDDIVDRRQRVVFHTLRHTFASWLVENGHSIYLVKELLGHTTITMAERYSHLGNKARQSGVEAIEKYSKLDDSATALPEEENL